MLVIMLNFIIAVITSTYSRVVNYQKIISYKNKADLNFEFYELFKLLGYFKEEIKLIVFSISKDTQDIEEDPIVNAQVDIKNHI